MVWLEITLISGYGQPDEIVDRNGGI